MTFSHAYKNITRYRKRYGFTTGFRAFTHYFFVALKKSKLNSTNNIIEVNGTKLEVIPGDLGTSLELLLFNTHEPISTQIVSDLLKNGMTCLDVGSNIGYYVTLESKILGEHGRIIAIEPTPKNFEFLKRNMEMQRARNIEIFNFAAGNKNGQINFLNYENESNSGQVIPDSEVSKWPGQVMKLPVKTIDSFLDESKIDKIDFVRMDVEGYEYHIFEGMQKTLQRFKPTVYIEVHKSIMGNKNTKQWLENMQKLGYEAKHYIPRELDTPMIGTLKDVKNYTINQLIRMLDSELLPSFFMLSLVNRNLDESENKKE